MISHIELMTREEAVQWTCGVVLIYLIIDFPISTAKYIPENKMLFRIAYIFSWCVGVWGMFIAKALVPENNIVFSLFGLMFFQASTIFFFAAKLFPLKRRWCGIVYAIFFAAWWILFMSFPDSIVVPISAPGIWTFFITRLLLQREDA